ncbi:uncharacterized protein LOC106866308 [Brachypodium distachyon]|nr:uncharacterized protein LOC106866308 [Brachypodium distachyon]KQK00341.1 hypothetical protein BRADI_3g48753v3 [Brachypodium distachyon]|eukprot:XP_024316182.1 uncharacterized protein LOC106866308 [Brachypodium distachyon]
MERVIPEQDEPLPPDACNMTREAQILQARSMCGRGTQSPHGGDNWRRRTEEERDASIICHVHHALRRYNANNPGSEFDPVKPLMAAYVGFRSNIWVHVSFLARKRNASSSKRRRSKADDPVKHFFAELRYDHHLCKPTVETCTIIDKSSRHLKTTCAFCPENFEILHPLDGNFVCGKKSQAKEGQGFLRFLNILEKPFTCPTTNAEAKDDEAAQEKGSSMLAWTLLPFVFIRDFITGFLWAFDDTLKAWINGKARRKVRYERRMVYTN